MPSDKCVLKIMSERDCHWKLAQPVTAASLLRSQVSSWLAKNFETLSQKNQTFSVFHHKTAWQRTAETLFAVSLLGTLYPFSVHFCHLVHFHSSGNLGF